MKDGLSQFSGSFGLLERPICRGVGLRFCRLRSSARRSGQLPPREIPFILPIHCVADVVTVDALGSRYLPETCSRDEDKEGDGEGEELEEE